MALNAAQVAAKWATRLQSSGEAMKAGVNAVTQSPTEAAANAKDRWIAGVQKAATEGTFESGLRAVSLSDWKQSYIDKGIPAVANAARVAQPKMEKFLRDFLPFADGVSQTVAAMPKGTLQDSINRATAAITMLASYKKRA